MAVISYQISSGVAPFIASISPAVVPHQHHAGVGIFTFEDVPEGYYTITITDSVGCVVSFGVAVDCGGLITTTSTTSTTIEPSTTTTSTTCNVDVEIIEPEACVSDTTTTTSTTTSYIVKCLEGMTVEAIYLHNAVSDIPLIPTGYDLPCYKFGWHGECNRAMYELRSYGVYLGDLLMNNNDGTDGGNTPDPPFGSGKEICRDYDNVPNELSQLKEGLDWIAAGGSQYSRYDKVVISLQKAIDMAALYDWSGNIPFTFIHSGELYGHPVCDASKPGVWWGHYDFVWIRVCNPDGDVIYNGCPFDWNFSVPMCGEPIVSTTTTSTTIPVLECLNGLTVEAIYLDGMLDLGKLPEGYTHPCQQPGYPYACEDIIMQHFCNRALFEIWGNTVYIGDSLMNNWGIITGAGTGTSTGGNDICKDYENKPDDFTGGVWTGTPKSRYKKYILTQAQILAIAATLGGGTIIQFSFIGRNDATTNCDGCCDEEHPKCCIPHDDVTWIRISTPTLGVLYNGCPRGQFFDLDVCSGQVITTTTTSSTTIPGTTTTTTTHTPTSTTTSTTSSTSSTTTTTTTVMLETVFIHIPII